MGQEKKQDRSQEELDAELRSAAALGEVAKAKALLARGADPRSTSAYNGCTPLMLAAANGRWRCVEALVGVSDPTQRGGAGKSPLMWAAQSGSAKCVGLLLSFNDPKELDGGGASALMRAADLGDEASVELLLPLSEPRRRGPGGKTAADCARDSGHPALARRVEEWTQARRERWEIDSQTPPAAQGRRERCAL